MLSVHGSSAVSALWQLMQVLVNPATSFERSVWPTLGLLLSNVPLVSPHSMQ